MALGFVSSQTDFLNIMIVTRGILIIIVIQEAFMNFLHSLIYSLAKKNVDQDRLIQNWLSNQSQEESRCVSISGQHWFKIGEKESYWVASLWVSFRAK